MGLDHRGVDPPTDGDHADSDLPLDDLWTVPASTARRFIAERSQRRGTTNAAI
jgi:hypothetical protein